MADTQIQAAITALLTVGMLLLTLGANAVQSGQFQTGIVMILVGATLIFGAVLLTTLLAGKVAEAKTAGEK